MTITRAVCSTRMTYQRCILRILYGMLQFMETGTAKQACTEVQCQREQSSGLWGDLEVCPWQSEGMRTCRDSRKGLRPLRAFASFRQRPCGCRCSTCMSLHLDHEMYNRDASPSKYCVS